MYINNMRFTNNHNKQKGTEMSNSTNNTIKLGAKNEEVRMKIDGKMVTFKNGSQFAKTLLAETFLPFSAIAELSGIKYQTVLRIDETHGIRAEANPKYAPKKSLVNA
jgi:hypothetical protein